MIELKNVTKFYKTPAGRKVILDDCSAKLDADRGIAILGKNGTGKSTIVRLLSGAELPNSGSIIRHGSCSWPMGLSGTFQTSMTARDNIIFVSRMYGRDEEAIVDYVEKFAELGVYLDMPVKTFSNGMKSRLAFGLSLAIKFDMYLIDEIFAVGDKRFAKRSKAQLKKITAKSKIILVSHQVSTIREYCDKVAVMHKGKLVLFNEINEGIRFYEEAHDQ